MDRFYWRPSWSKTLRFPVVVKRTPVKGQIDLFHGGYKYYGVVTNMSLLNRSIQSIFEHHHFIKEVQRLREGLQLNPEMNPAFLAGFSSG